MDVQIALFLASTIRVAMPMMLAATGELVSERAGVLNLSLEGMMLMGAFFAAMGNHYTGSASVGILFAILAVIPFALLQAFLSVTLRANQLVVGIGLNLVALGITTLAYREVFGALSRETLSGFNQLHIPLLSDIPFIGTVFFSHTILAYVGIILIAIIWFVLNRTAVGLTIRAIGENPRATDQAGISVFTYRYVAILVTGCMAALAGSFLSLSDIHTFTENMTNGTGYIALAAVIFGNWRVWKTVMACLLFGAASALQFQLPGWSVQIPTAWLLMLPYILALFSVAGLVGRVEQPLSLALPYRRHSD